MSKPKLGMSKAEFYKVMAIALAVSLVISWALFYGYYVSVQPLIKSPGQSFKEKPFNLFQVQGIISVYKNGILVHQGPDVLTNAFYDYLPFLLGNVCATSATDAPTTCPAGSWTDTAFMAPPPALSCSLTNALVSTAPSRVPITGALGGLSIAIGSGTSASPSDCVLGGPLSFAGPSIAVYSVFTNNANNPPAPCPNPSQGCVQINATISFATSQTISEAALYAPYSKVSGSTVYTLIAHDIFQSVSVNAGDRLTIVYTFIFPGAPTNAGAYNTNQGVLAPLFAQCLSRQYFQIGTGTNRICLDPVVWSASITVWLPANPCSDTQLGANTVNSGNNKITIEASAAGKYVKIYAPMSAAGSGIQLVKYSVGLYDAIFASQSCSVATQQSFVAGQPVGLQLTFP